jgi:hypothetical protein
MNTLFFYENNKYGYGQNYSMVLISNLFKKLQENLPKKVQPKTFAQLNT